nr:DNA polymerase III subunit gamma and tau [Leucobacter chromiireducens]
MVAALYRRYRPEAFAEMIGQSQVTDPLMTALRSGRIGHAYLFSGPRGCGKTTSARILARCLNCAEGPTDTPCGTCPSCVELSRDGGGSLDVVEIDAASHGGVDDARELRERAVFAPARDRFKIFIIDEAHMVTPGGFNALLKIVEEPPPHVKFVFATTEPDKVIGTIRSRTHHYPFRLIAPATLIDYVQSLCDSEGVQVEPGVLPLVVRAGGGSVRDTLSILDQLIAGSETALVTAERAAGLLGFTHTELLDDVVSAFGAHDPAAAFQATDRVVQTGQDPRRFVEDLLERLRDLIVVSATTVDGAAAVFRGVPQDQLTRMFEQAQRFAPGELSRTADVVAAALDSMAGATAPRLQLELMVARVLVQAAGAPAAQVQAAQVPAAQAPVAAGAAQAAAPVQPPAQPPAPPVNPLSAVAAARSAAAAPAAPTPAAAAPTPAAAAPTPAAVAPAASSGQGSDPSAPNAAQTAASIREFLREDTAGTSAAPAPAAAEAAAAPDAAPSAEPAPASDSAPASAPVPEPAPGAVQDTAPHPNAGAASFGRPISDVLSAAQIESIGSEPTTPAPKPPQAAPAPEQAAPVAAQQGNEPNAELPEGARADSSGEAPGFDDLVELWPELLEEILEADRDAWSAVSPVVPVALDGDVLTVGLASESDLAAFKSAGAGPLRETILSAVGISVKYKPTRVAQGSGPAAQNTAREPQADSDAEEPHRAGSPAPQPHAATPDAHDPVARAAARLNGLGPALAAPAWAGPIPEAPETAAAPAAPAEAAAPAAPAEASVPAGAAASGAPEPPGAPAAAEPQAAAPAPTEEATAPAEPAAAPAEPAASAEPAATVAPAPAAPTTGPAGAEPQPSATIPSDPYAGGDPYDDADAAPSDEYEDAYGDPYGRSANSAAPAVDAPQQPSVAAPPQPSVPEALPQGGAAPAGEERRSAPAFTRYGEAVVREVLGARFVEERPLPGQ